MNDRLTSVLTQCIDGLERGEMTLIECVENYPEFKDELRDLLDVMQSIKTIAHEPVEEDFRWRTRASLVNKVISHKPASIWDKFRLWIKETSIFRNRVAKVQIVLVIALLLSLVSGGSVLAAENAVPGDFLYPLKMFVEELRMAIIGEDDDVELHLRFAEKRLREVESLAEKGRFEGIGTAIDRFEYHIEGATRPDLADKKHDDILRDWRLYELSETIIKHQEVLERLLEDEVVVDEARAAIEHAIEASTKGQAKLNELFPEGFPAKPPIESIPAPDIPKPQTEPEFEEVPGIPELPVEIPVDTEVTPPEGDEGVLPIPLPVGSPPGRP